MFTSAAHPLERQHGYLLALNAGALLASTGAAIALTLWRNNGRAQLNQRMAGGCDIAAHALGLHGC